jgi:hypothetical protein
MCRHSTSSIVRKANSPLPLSLPHNRPIHADLCLLYLGIVSTTKPNRFGKTSTKALLQTKRWMGQPEEERWDMEPEEQAKNAVRNIANVSDV